MNTLQKISYIRAYTWAASLLNAYMKSKDSIKDKEHIEEWLKEKLQLFNIPFSVKVKKIGRAFRVQLDPQES